MIKTEILKEFRKKFELKYDSGSYIQMTMQAIEPIEEWLSTSLDQVREQTLEEVGKIIGDERRDLENISIDESMERLTRNELRSEQREALTKLKGEKSE